jgi:hypothetical protein
MSHPVGISAPAFCLELRALRIGVGFQPGEVAPFDRAGSAKSDRPRRNAARGPRHAGCVRTYAVRRRPSFCRVQRGVSVGTGAGGCGTRRTVISLSERSVRSARCLRTVGSVRRRLAWWTQSRLWNQAICCSTGSRQPRRLWTDSCEVYDVAKDGLSRPAPQPQVPAVARPRNQIFKCRLTNG